MKNYTLWLGFGFVVVNIVLVTHFVGIQNQLAYISYNMSVSMKRMEARSELLHGVLVNVSAEHDEIAARIGTKFGRIRGLVEESRKNIIRIKNLPEKKGENLVEKLIQVSQLLEVPLVRDNIEKIYRMNVPTKVAGYRTIVAHLSDRKITKKLIHAASKTNGEFHFTIQTDLSSYMMPYKHLYDVNQGSTNCGAVTEIGAPETVTKWNEQYGAWLPDFAASSSSDGPYWILSNFEDNNVVQEFANLRGVVRKRASKTYELPYEWAGTGHVIINGSLFYNKKDSNKIVKYNFEERRIEVERAIPDALFNNEAPYQWLGYTDIDLSLDEKFLWAIYATHDNAQDIVLSRLNPATLQIEMTWKTNWRKQWCSNAFVVCGVLYTLKKYDVRESALGFTYDTSSKRYKHANIAFYNKYEWNTMLSYNPSERRLYAWDNGYLVYYNVTVSRDTT